jgi:hypothetical protein
MMIHDLEFFNSCAQEAQNSDVAIVGGASADSYATTSAGGNSVFAQAEVAAQGDYSNTAARVGGTIVSNPAYTDGYSVGYAAGYAVDRYDSVASTQSSSVSLF